MSYTLVDTHYRQKRDHLWMRKGRRRVHRQLVTQFGLSGQWWLHLYRSLGEETSQQQQTMQGKNVLQQEEQHSVVVFFLFRSVAESTSRRRHCCQPTRRTLRVLIRANYSREQQQQQQQQESFIWPTQVWWQPKWEDTHSQRNYFSLPPNPGRNNFYSYSIPHPLPKLRNRLTIKKWKSQSQLSTLFQNNFENEQTRNKIPRLFDLSRSL